MLWQFVGSGLLGAATVPFAWTSPSAFDVGLMFLVGAVSIGCYIFITRALALARAAVLAPLQCSAILWAAIMGWLVWRDAPTLPIIVGNAIIIGSGLFVATGAGEPRNNRVPAPSPKTTRAPPLPRADTRERDERLPAHSATD